MKLLTALITLIMSVLCVACSDKGITKTDNGLLVAIRSESPIRLVGLYVVDEKTIAVTATRLEHLSPQTSESMAIRTPFNTITGNDDAIIATQFVGIKVNRATPEISFLDSIGNILLTLLPGRVAAGNIDCAATESENYHLIFSQADSVITAFTSDSVSADNAVVATAGYNVLWRPAADGLCEEYFLVYGEQINNYITPSDSIISKLPLCTKNR